MVKKRERENKHNLLVDLGPMMIMDRHGWTKELGGMRNFLFREFVCRHCKKLGRERIYMDPQVVKFAQIIRDDVGKKFKDFRMIITDGSRCNTHPRVLKKIEKYGRGGAHNAGQAFDFLLEDLDHYPYIIDVATRLNLRGLGDGRDCQVPFLHLDWWSERKHFTKWGYR